MSDTQKNVFIDCGSNLGQGCDKIIDMLNLNNCQVYMFEPNKICYEQLIEKYPTHKIYNKAVWDKDEVRTLNVEFCPIENNLCGGASNILLDNYIKPDYIRNEYMEEWPPKHSQAVECLSLSKFIKENIDLNSSIVLKLDVEGAEIEIIDQMISDDILKYIKVILVEWHFHLRKQTDKNEEYYLNKFIENNVQYIRWY